MKKILGFITVILLMLVLTACSVGKEATRTFVLDKDGITTTMVYTYKGDKVTKQTTENVIIYELVGVTSKKQAQEILDPMSAQFQNYDGLIHKMEYDDTKAIEKLTIDYTVVDFEKIKNLPGMTFDDNVGKKGISMIKSAELVEGQGFKEVK